MSDSSTTHDLRDDFDDAVGVPADMPTSVKWAAVCWIVFAVFNLGVMWLIGYLSLTEIEETPNYPACVFVAMLIFFFGTLTISFAHVGRLAFKGESAWMNDSLLLSWAVTAGFVALWGCTLGCIVVVFGLRNLPVTGACLSFCYIAPVLTGSILATLGQHDYVKWKARLVTPSPLAGVG